MNNRNIVLNVDQGCSIYFELSCKKSIISLLKYSKHISGSVKFYISEKIIIIRSKGDSICESIIYTENLLNFHIEYSERMLNDLGEDDNIYIEVFFNIVNLVSAIPTDLGRSLVFNKPSDSNTFDIYIPNATLVNSIGHTRHNSNDELYYHETDISNYFHTVTFILKEFISTFKNTKSFPSDSMIVLYYYRRGIAIEIISGNSSSSNFGIIDDELLQIKTFDLSQLSSIKSINGIMPNGLIKCYISNNYSYMLLVVSFADIGISKILIKPKKNEIIQI